MPCCVFINPAVVLGRMGNVSGILDGAVAAAAAAAAAARVTCAFDGCSLTYLERRTMKEKER